MKTFFLLILFIFSGKVILAQDTLPVPEEMESLYPEILDRLHVNQDSMVEKMLIWHIEKNKKVAGLEGYRVEIFFSSGLNAKEEAFKQKVEFLSKYPENNVYVKYEAPDFKLRVGDFRTKNEALKLREKIKEDYPLAFIVPDKIEFPLLKPFNYE